MGKFSDKDLDQLFSDKLSQLNEKPSDETASRIFDSIVDHSFQPSKKRPIIPLPFISKQTMRYIAVATASAAAGILLTLTFLQQNEIASKAMPIADVSEMEQNKTIEQTIDIKDESLRSKEEVATHINKQSTLDIIPETENSTEITSDFSSLKEQNIKSERSNSTSTIIAQADTKETNISPEIKNFKNTTEIQTTQQQTGETSESQLPPVPPVKTEAGEASSENSHMAIVSDLRFETTAEQTNNNTENSSTVAESPFYTQTDEMADSASLDINEAVAIEEPVEESDKQEFFPLTEPEKGVLPKKKLQSFASIDAGVNKLNTNSAEADLYGGMQTNAICYTVKYKNVGFSIGAGYAQVKINQNYQIEQVNEYYSEIEDVQYFSLNENLKTSYTTERKTVINRTIEKSDQQLAISNSYVTLPISGSYLVSFNKLQTGIKGSVVFIYLLNSKGLDKELDQFENISDIQSKQSLNKNTLALELSIPLYYNIWKQTQIFTEVAGQTYTNQLIGDNQSNHQLVSFGARAGLQFKL